MRIIIGEIVIDVPTAGNFIYDAVTDTLTIFRDATHVPRIIEGTAKPAKTAKKEKAKPAFKHQTTEELEEAVLKVLKEAAPEAVSSIVVTQRSIGFGAHASELKTLKVLLDEMAEQGKIVVHPGPRRKFSLPDLVT